jgi:hypothetical protein
MSVSIRSAAFPLILFGAHAALGTAQAAEGFEPRYNLAGSIGGEIFAPPTRPAGRFASPRRISTSSA